MLKDARRGDSGIGLSNAKAIALAAIGAASVFGFSGCVHDYSQQPSPQQSQNEQALTDMSLMGFELMNLRNGNPAGARAARNLRHLNDSAYSSGRYSGDGYAPSQVPGIPVQAVPFPEGYGIKVFRNLYRLSNNGSLELRVEDETNVVNCGQSFTAVVNHPSNRAQNTSYGIFLIPQPEGEPLITVDKPSILPPFLIRTVKVVGTDNLNPHQYQLIVAEKQPGQETTVVTSMDLYVR
jgi:hypothetical protein